jgi:nucleoid-associated protein YgaU
MRAAATWRLRRCSTIAARELGYEKRLVEILAVNRTTIPDPDRYYAGQVINLPQA